MNEGAPDKDPEPKQDPEIVDVDAEEEEEGEEEGEEEYGEQLNSKDYESNQEGQKLQPISAREKVMLPKENSKGDNAHDNDHTLFEPPSVRQHDLSAIANIAYDDQGEQEALKQREAKRNGIFHVHGKKVVYERYSLFCIDSHWKFRQGIVWLIEWKWFDRFITAVILGNSIMLAMTDYKGRLYGDDYVSSLNNQLEKVDLAFTAIFIFECVAKILGMGFVVHKNSYLRDGWNWLDFFVVLVSLVNFVPNIDSGGLKALRTFRILRPLRTINQVPMMKQQIQSLLSALPGLVGIMTFLVLMYSVFAIFAVQSFAGNQYQYCRTTATPDIVLDKDGNVVSYDWPIVDTFSWLCKSDDDCKKLVQMFGPEDLDVYKCGSSWEYKIKAGGKDKYDSTVENEQILYDVVNFNHMGLAFLTIFQSLTMESWSTLMYNYMDSNNAGMSVFFFCFLIIFGAFFTMQLVLAEIIESFTKEKARREDEKREQEIAEYQENLKKAQDIGQKAEEEEGDAPILTQQELHVPTPKLSGNDRVEEPEEEEIDDSAFEDEAICDRDARRRSHTQALYRMFFLFVINPWFNCFIFLMILLNTLSLAADDYPMYDKKEMVIDICNQYFTWLFTAEMVCKLIGLGPNNYMKDAWNKLDSFIVVISLIDWTIQMTVGDNVGGAGAVLQTFRAMRLLRIIKLARRWTELQEILGKVFMSLSELSIFCCLLLLFMYIFALLGMQFFSMRAYTDLDDVIVPVDEILERYPNEVLTPVRVNFNNIGLSLTTVFCVIFAEDWNWDMYVNIVPFGVNLHYYAMFFLIVFVFGNYVLFALFAAILLSHFEGGGDDEEEEEEESEIEGYLEEFDESKQKKGLRSRLCSREALQSIKAGFIDMFGKKLRNKHIEKQGASVKVEPLESEEVDGKKEKEEENPFDTNRPMRTDGPLSADSRGERVQSQNDSANKTRGNQVHPGGQISNVSESSEESVASLEEKPKNLLTSKLHPSTSVLLRHYSINEKTDSLGNDVDLSDVTGYSFYCFGPDNALRCAAARFEKSKSFNNVILILIGISTINLAIETPLDKPGIMKLQVLQYIDYFMTAAFTFEMCIKMFSYGFAFTGPHAYIKQGWNILDFVIVCSALIGLNPNASGSLKALKTLRILRVLRPLKLASKNKGLKVAITALFQSLPNIGNLQLIIMFFLFLFGILHTTLFAGQFWSCSHDHVELTYEQKFETVESQWDCLNSGGEWVNNDFNFDTTLRSVLTLFCLQSTEGWVDNMWSEVDSTGQYMQPKTGNKPIMIIFGIFIEILINLLFLNLFVGVVIETFNSEKEKINRNTELSAEQKHWIQVQLMGYQATPLFQQQLTGHGCRDMFIKFVLHPLFDQFIMACIILNTIVLMFKWYSMSQGIIDVIQFINYGFMTIFTIEAICKIFALRSNYFRAGWNIFDFIVVVGTLLILLLGLLPFMNTSSLGIQSTILRSLRIGRILRLLRKMKQLQIIFNTIFEALPSMASLGMLLLLLMFMYAIIGMSQFGFINITDQENADYHANFQNFLNSFLLLFRCATGEAWDSIMFDFGRGHHILFQCDAQMEYAEYEANGFVTNKCGNAPLAYGFFISFIIFCVQVFLNLFVAVIVDAYTAQSARAELPIQAIDIQLFQETWLKYDGEGKGFIRTRDLQPLIMNLLENNSCELIMFRSKLKEQKMALYDFIASLDIPTFKNFRFVMFYDVLLSLIREKSKFAYDQKYYDMRRKRASKKRDYEKSGIMNAHQIEKVLNKEYKIDEDFSFDKNLQSFVRLDNTIELVNEIEKTSAAVAKKFKLGKEKADENVDEETGQSRYYTTKQFIYGTWIVDTWRDYEQQRKDRAQAQPGEKVNGQTKIMDHAPYAKKVTNVPQDIKKSPQNDGNRQNENDPHRDERRPENSQVNQAPARIVDTNFGEQRPGNNNLEIK